RSGDRLGPTLPAAPDEGGGRDLLHHREVDLVDEVVRYIGVLLANQLDPAPKREVRIGDRLAVSLAEVFCVRTLRGLRRLRFLVRIDRLLVERHVTEDVVVLVLGKDGGRAGRGGRRIRAGAIGPDLGHGETLTERLSHRDREAVTATVSLELLCDLRAADKVDDFLTGRDHAASLGRV